MPNMKPTQSFNRLIDSITFGNSGQGDAHPLFPKADLPAFDKDIPVIHKLQSLIDF